jgi:hypothetical protein
MSLVQLLVDLPDGRTGLATYIRNLANKTPDTVADLMKQFPALGGSDQSLEKRWLLTMARFSTADRYAGLSIEETEKRIAALTALQLPVGKTTQSFRLDQFNEFLKIRESRSALAQMGGGLLALQTTANPLFRRVVFEYQKIAMELADGRTHGIQDRLNTAAKYRASLLGRMNDIADYLNWFEATQTTARSDAFAGYFKAAGEMSAVAPKRHDPISQYLNSVEVELQ